MDKTEFLELAQQAEAAASAYYSGGTSSIDDATYDQIIRSLQSARDENTSWSEADDLLDKVAAGEATTGNVPFSSPMLSLSNCVSAADVSAFVNRVTLRLGEAAPCMSWAVEPKLDGCALNLIYSGGKLQVITTRQDGLSGEDVTMNAKHVRGVLPKVPGGWTGEVRGECIMTREDFSQANALREQHGDSPFVNPRNGISGSLITKHRGYTVPMTFYAYDLISRERSWDTHDQSMLLLQEWGFLVARQVTDLPNVFKHEAEIISAIEHIGQVRTSLPLEIDGAVIKVNEIDLRDQLGSSAKSPRWAIAYKYPAQVRITRLLGITEGVGRTGNISYTAELEPVQIGGTTVARAMVHNPEEIARHGFRLPIGEHPGQLVEVYRAGDVIPQIRGVVNPDDVSGTAPYVPSESCPNGHGLIKDQKVWRCEQGRNCDVRRALYHFASRDYGLDITGLGKVHISALVSKGILLNPEQLFTLTEEDLLQADRLGEKNAAKILGQINQAKQAPMYKVFSALGIDMTGRSMSKRLAQRFPSLQHLRVATIDQLMEVEGVGPDRAKAIRDDLDLLTTTIRQLIDIGVGVSAPEAVSSPETGSPNKQPLAGLTVVVTGTVPGYSRQAAQDLVEQLGGRSSSSVSSKTDLVIVGEGAGSKANKASQLGIRTMPAEELAQMGGAG